MTPTRESGREFTVLSGNRRAIVAYESAPEGETVRAYEDLVAYLARATGVEFVAVSEDDFRPTDDKPVLYVGRCRALPEEDQADLESMDRDAYLVHITPEAAYLAGSRPWSTYWAVCQFLEDHVGVRWLIPGELGEDVPERGRITVPLGRQVHTPTILSRLWSGAHYGGVWSLRQRIHARYQFHHNLLRVFDPDLYDEHPEWFPLRADTRYRPGEADHSWQPCMASESSVQHAADAARLAWAANPDLDSFSYGCNDGQGWCTCEGCQAMDREMPPWGGFEGTYSHRYFGWLNRVAAELEKTHPDKLIGCLAYSTYILPPEGLDLHPNIIPYLTSNRADYGEPEFRAQDQALLERWGEAANLVGIYDYAYGMGFAVPRIYTHLLQEALQHAVKQGVKGFYAEVYPNWGLDGPKLYLMSRMLWDPSVDVDAVMKEWNERMFREAAEPMAAFFARCERAWREQDTGRGHWAYRLAANPKQFQIFPPSVLAECSGYLADAAERATSSQVKERIQFFQKTWEVTLLLAGRYWASRDVETLIASEAPMDQVAEAMRQMADQLAPTDIDAYIDERVGDDPVAFHPPKQSWISPLKAGAETNAKRWTAAHLAGEVVERRGRSRGLDAPTLRRAIDTHIEKVFGTEGSETYREIVGQIASMARKVATVARVQDPPRIDGTLDDTAWRRADELAGFSAWGQVSPSDYITRAWMVHDRSNLYVALECRQDTSNLHLQAAPRDGHTWRDDSVEFFINPQMAEFPYVQFIITPNGAFFDQWAQDETQSYRERLAADFDCEWAADIQEDRWTAEMRLPLAQFHCTPAERPLLRVDLVRNVQGEHPEISTWFPSVGAHADPLSRGWIVFE